MKISNGFLFSVEDNPQKQWLFTLQLNGISGNLHNWVLDFESDLHEFSMGCLQKTGQRDNAILS